MTSYCHPLHCGVNQETPKLLEGSYGEGKDYGEVVRSIRLRGICESVLDARLQRLIRRQKFDEAEKFAVKFKLSLEQVFQVSC